MLDFNVQGLQEIHFIKEVGFPIAIPIYSDWEKVQIGYLNRYIDRMNVEDVIKWCINHKMQYEVLYPLSLKMILLNPYKYLIYLRMKRRLHRELREGYTEN